MDVEATVSEEVVEKCDTNNLFSNKIVDRLAPDNEVTII